MKLYAFGKIEVDNIAKRIHGDTIDEGSYGPNPKEGFEMVKAFALVK